LIKYIINEVKNTVFTLYFVLVVSGYILFLTVPFFQELFFDRTNDVNIAYIWTISTNHTSISLALVTIANLLVADFIARDIRQGVIQYTLPRMGKKKYFFSKVLICIILTFVVVILSNAIIIYCLSFSFPLLTTPIESNENILYNLTNGFLIRNNSPMWFYAWLIFKQGAEITCVILVSLVVSFFSQSKLVLYTVPLTMNVLTIFLDKLKLLPMLLDPRKVFSFYNILDRYFGGGELEEGIGLATVYPIIYLMGTILIIYLFIIILHQRQVEGGYR